MLGVAFGKPVPQETPVYLYCRASSEKQEEAETIGNQVAEAEAFFASSGITCREMFLDDNVQGETPIEERPHGARLLQMLDALPPGKIALVYVWRVDRLGRAARITLNAEYELMKRRGVVRSILEPFDVTTDYGRHQFDQLASAASYEKATILTRLSSGSYRWAKQGVWQGGNLSYGVTTEVRKQRHYYVYDHTPFPGRTDGMNPARVVLLIYERLIDHKETCTQIASYLAALGIPTAYQLRNRPLDGKPVMGAWTAALVRQIVVNPFYKGTTTYGKTSKKKEPVQVEVPALITPERWDAGQAALRRNQQDAPRNAKHEYLLRGVIFCGFCGAPMRGKSRAKQTPGGGYYRYYVCSKHDKSHYYKLPDGQTGPTCKCFIHEEIEAEVWADVVQYLNNPEDISAALVTALAKHDEDPAPLVAEIATLQAAIEAKGEERARAISLYTRLLITDDEVQKTLLEIETAKRELEAEIDRRRKRIQQIEGRGKIILEWEALLPELRERLNHPLTTSDRRDIIKHLVIKTVVTGVTAGRRKKFHPVAETFYRFDNPAEIT